MKNERRKYPRVGLAGEVGIQVQGIVRSCTLINLSPSGIQVECRRHLIEQLNQFKSEAGLFPPCDLEFSLPDDRTVQARCDISYCRRLSQDSYHLGLNFSVLSAVDEERVDDFINHSAAA